MTNDHPVTGWYKASQSGNNGDCVEVHADGSLVLVRDSKYLRDPANDPAAQPFIAIPAAQWEPFLATALSDSPALPGLPTITRTDTGTTLTAVDGTTLRYTPAEWAAFTAGVKNGEFSIAISPAEHRAALSAL